MKLLKTALISTLFLAGTAQAIEPVKATKINTLDLQVAAQHYLAQNLPVIALNTRSTNKEVLLAKAAKPATNEKLVDSASLIAE